MKTRFYTQTLIALAAALTATTANISRAEEHPIPPPVAESSLPPNIPADSSLAQIVKLVQAGLDLSVITNFIANSASTYDLDAEKIIALTDTGVPPQVINAMLVRDKILFAAANNPPAPTPAVVTKTVVVAATAPPAAPITVNYFSDTLAPYGTWVDVDGYGRCWRPTVVNYDSGWRPYCDRGHWVYTDCGWYWDSDYSWGATFHYGRWFRNSHLGWCWYPDTEWAPSWVTWRSCDDYRGWAPLPPFATFRSGSGFFYRGENVSVSFGFGLGSDCFTFVGSSHFYDHHPRRFCPEEREVVQIFNRTTIINNYNVVRSHDGDRGGNRGGDQSAGRGGDRGDDRGRIINNGIPVAQVGKDQHHEIKPVQIASLPNAGRHGWRGNDDSQPGVRGDGDNRPAGGNVSKDNNERRPLPVLRPNGGDNSARPGTPISGGATRNDRGGFTGNADKGNESRRPLPVQRPNAGGNASAAVTPVVVNPAPGTSRNDRGGRSDNAGSPVQVQTGGQSEDLAGQKRNSEHLGVRQIGNGNNRPATAIIPPHNPPMVIQQSPNLDRNSRRDLDDLKDRPEAQNRFRTPVLPPAQPVVVPPQISLPAPAERSRPQNETRPPRSFESPVVVSRPAAPERREPIAAPRSEPRPSQVESAPRSFSPPPVVQAPAPAPAPSQPAARSENQSRSAERNSARTADRDDAKDRNDKRNR